MTLQNSKRNDAYYSNWRKVWIDFTPTVGELLALKKYHYEVREKI